LWANYSSREQIQRAKIRDIQLAERTDAIIRDCAWAVQL
jgi:hypothetical protein